MHGYGSLSETKLLSEKAIKLIQETPPDQRAIASISIWEFAMMATRGRITVRIDWKRWLSKAVSMSGLKVLEITPKIATESCSLPGEFHKDPADRIIVATARSYNSTLLTRDKKILKYQHVNAVW